MKAYYPSFLKNRPLIWGVSLNDLLLLSGVLFLFVTVGMPEVVTLGGTTAVYGMLILSRRLFPRRHFELVLISKNSITRKVINEKIKSF